MTLWHRGRRRQAASGPLLLWKVWQVTPTGVQESFTLAGHAAGADTVVFSANGKRLLTSSQDGTKRAYAKSGAADR